MNKDMLKSNNYYVHLKNSESNIKYFVYFCIYIQYCVYIYTIFVYFVYFC